MQHRGFWIRRFLAAAIVAFAVIVTAHLLRGRAPSYAISEALLWSFITAWVYMLGIQRNIRKNRNCALCPTPLNTREESPE